MAPDDDEKAAADADVNAAASAKVAGLLKDQIEAVALLERLTLKRTANLNIDYTHKAFLFPHRKDQSFGHLRRLFAKQRV